MIGRTREAFAIEEPGEGGEVYSFRGVLEAMESRRPYRDRIYVFRYNVKRRNIAAADTVVLPKAA